MLENLNENNIWEKRFSVGIAIETTLSDFEGMLENYGRYIDNFYCSLPLGDKFHGRTHVANQFKNPENIQKFWEIAKMINKSDVGFEIVFNTDKLIEEDFYMCRNELEKHGITVDKIAILDKYYELVSAIFPNVKLVNSVNNMPNTLDGIRQISHKYDEIVIGRQFIRNIDAFHIVTEELGSDCVLLVNNGCSHICGGCRSFDYCNDCYEKEKKRTSAEYLYALQSILPYEISEEYFDTSAVKLFKLSTRNADTEFICKCIDSYIHDNGKEYEDKSPHHYKMWLRLMWHQDHFDSFDYERIRSIKQEICKKQ